jgi:hypothetical protein
MHAIDEYDGTTTTYPSNDLFSNPAPPPTDDAATPKTRFLAIFYNLGTPLGRKEILHDTNTTAIKVEF